ncbi:MAG TPA: endolytic transglycosylase MltG, partial [Gemmatimonadaceae bacterium]|nr:endolytic transglycosylase MltG [Gemmatimonadaceae bacterium]
MRPRVLALAMLVVIVGLGVATAVLVSGLVRESRAAGESLLRLSEVVLSDGEPLDASAPARRFRIERGETAASIAERLERDGFISSALAFRTRARLEGLDVRFEAGEYEISAAMRPSEIMMRLLRGRFAS